MMHPQHAGGASVPSIRHATGRWPARALGTSWTKARREPLLAFVLWAIFASLLVAPLSAHAQLTIQVSSSTHVMIPDDDPSGALSSLQVSAPWVSIGTVHVSLRLESVSVNNPMFNGDLYVYLSHTDAADNSGIAVLLNRAGREGDNPYGYDDNGFNVTFNDSATSGDVHGYRSTLYGNPNAPIPSPGSLIGTWSPDGRETDPDSTVGGDARTAMLSGFAGLDPNGVWTLFLADVSSGGQAKLVSWDLTVLSAVPEPTWCAFAAAAALLGWGLLGRQKSEGRLQKAEGAGQNLA